MGNFTEVGVIEVLVSKGDKVDIDTPLVTLETEKATMDVPSTAAGVDVLLLVTAALGLVWNAGELIVSIERDFDTPLTLAFLAAGAYSALGFLPSVVVHSAQNEAGRSRGVAWLAYALSFLAAILHFRAAVTGEPVRTSAPVPADMQALLVALFCLWPLLRMMGRDYDAAVMAGGHCGFGLGATPNAVANMTSLVERFGAAPRAFLVLPMVGAFFIDFTNALIITFFVNWLR